MAAQDGITVVRIHNVNTCKIIAARIATPNRRVTYEGDAAIDGVRRARRRPIHLAFLNAAGAKTGKLLPTARPMDHIGGLDVTCIDAATPLVIFPGGPTSGRPAARALLRLDADRAFMARLEAVRIEAGERMGFRNVRSIVIPKPVLVGAPAKGGTVAGRYFMPHACHKAFAITGAVGLATACATAGTIAEEVAGRAPASARRHDRASLRPPRCSHGEDARPRRAGGLGVADRAPPVRRNGVRKRPGIQRERYRRLSQSPIAIRGARTVRFRPAPDRRPLISKPQGGTSCLISKPQPTPMRRRRNQAILSTALLPGSVRRRGRYPARPLLARGCRDGEAVGRRLHQDRQNDDRAGGVLHYRDRHREHRQ